LKQVVNILQVERINILVEEFKETKRLFEENRAEAERLYQEKIKEMEAQYEQVAVCCKPFRLI
jgi:hypothetical protein